MYSFNLFFCIFFFFLLLKTSYSTNGWAATDRFAGFRYEIVLPYNPTEFEILASKIIQIANDYGCFGWVQMPKDQSKIVGEARCSKVRGGVVKEKISSLVGPTASFYDYPDTRIRFHFSGFYSLPPERETCFIEPPHQCPDLANAKVEL